MVLRLGWWSGTTSAPGLGPSLPHLRRDWARQCDSAGGRARHLWVKRCNMVFSVATWWNIVCGLATCCTVLRRTSITASARSKEAVRSELCACDARLQYSRVPPGAVLPSAYSTLEYRQGPKLGSIWCVASTITHAQMCTYFRACVDDWRSFQSFSASRWTTLRTHGTTSLPASCR